MKRSYTLYQKGLAISVDIFVFNDKVCIRENSNSGEHLTYVSKDSETALLKALEANSLLQRLFERKKTNVPEDKQKILALMAEKFTDMEKDPDPKIRDFFKKHEIKYTTDYWPDSDRF
ncbi:MAG: hypothetical protein AAGL29_07880 [Bacteroidota bacterium]